MSFNTIQEAKQYIFNSVVRGLASQEWERCQSIDAQGTVSCTFNKGKPGFHCALGWLIPWENQKELDPTTTLLRW